MSHNRSSPEHNSPEQKQPQEPKRDYNNSPYTYATLMETSGEESEGWYYFIRYQGNEDALKYLETQLDSVEWYTLEDLSTYVIETQYLVSENTAKEMTKIDLNSQSFHRKFDGKLQRIDLKLKDRYSTERKMAKVFDVLGYGSIEDFVSDEDLDPEDLRSHSEEDNSSEQDSGSESESEPDSEPEQRKKTVLPPSMSRSNLPRNKRYKNQRKHR